MPSNRADHEADLPPAGLARRMAAMTYDALLVIALMMVGTALAIIPAGGEITAGNLLFQAYLLALWYLYFALCWRLGGQTVGMKAWRLAICTAQRDRPDWLQVAIRFFMAFVSLAPAGLGFLWSLVDRDRRSWHDLASGTRLVVLPRHSNRAP